MLNSLLKRTPKPKPTNEGVPPALSSAGGEDEDGGGGALPGLPSLGRTGSGSTTAGAGSGHFGSHAHADVDPTPRADVALPHHAPRRERRRSSVVRADRAAVMKELPQLKDAPLARREALFQQKLALCRVTFDWDDPEADKRNKELKRSTLIELLDYINSPGGQKIFTEAVQGDVVTMVAENIFRALPPPSEGSAPGGEEVTGISGGEEDEEQQFLDPAWAHLSLVYEFLLRFIVSSEVKAKSAKKYIDTTFCAKLIEMFDSEDPRERDYLKTILHRIYGKFMTHRAFIRKSISNVFYRFVYETERHNGVSELLEILGSIINGFALPLKQEHMMFLERALLPLHRPRCLPAYFQQLTYCITQYIEKDPTSVVPIINGLIKNWPWASSGKQIVFLNELEDIMDSAGPEAVLPAVHPLMKCLSKCVGSTHFQVAERALFLWNNETLLTTGILSKTYAAEVLPIMYASLYKNASGHWNTTVETMAANVLKHYQDADPGLFDKCAADMPTEQAKKAQEVADRAAKWALIEQMAAANAPPMSMSASGSTSTAGSGSSGGSSGGIRSGAGATVVPSGMLNGSSSSSSSSSRAAGGIPPPPSTTMSGTTTRV